MSSGMKSPIEETLTHELQESTKKKAKILQKFLKGEISREQVSILQEQVTLRSQDLRLTSLSP